MQSQKHDRENDKGDNGHPNESKKQCQGEYLVDKSSITNNSKQKENNSMNTANRNENMQAIWNETKEKRSTINESNQSELLSIINKVIKEGIRATYPLPFKFKNTSEVADHSAKILKEHDFDIAKVLEKYNNTVFHPGTEFCPVQSLEKLLRKHKDWPKLEKIITSGIRYGS